MKKQSPTFLLTIVILVLFSSCSSIYMPNTPSAPMLSKKGELHLEGHMSLKTNLSINTAYALQDHFAVMLNGSTVNSDGKNVDYRQKLIEGGFGYFNSFGPEKNRIFEIYLGVGKVNTSKTIRTMENDIQQTQLQDFGLQKIFVQSNFSNKKAGNLNLFGKKFPLNYGTVLRLSYLNMNRFTINQQAKDFEDNLFFEPLFFTRLKLSDVFQLQYTSGTTIGLKKRNVLKAGNSVMTLGVIFDFGKK